MKTKKIICCAMATVTALASCLVGCMAGKGCNKQEQREEQEIVLKPQQTYKNHMEIEGQWGASQHTGANGQYGIGDPFVMRYNGKYYMYPSTSDPCDGIKVFESSDLVNWEYKGFAVAESEPTVHGAYAPEVVYYNGYFYMCQSRAGKGHYIYRSESPTHGFKLISKTVGGDTGDINYGNVGLGIDGAFHVDDNGKLYIMHTITSGGLRYNEFLDVDNISTETISASKTLGMASLGHWIEGPGVFRRGEYSYLTYTGNHVISSGYRVGYSYAKNLKNLGDFTQPIENITLLSTDPNHLGLGHSSNTNGPNLDSVYTAYHSYVGGGPQRRYNLDRYFAFAGLVTANGVTNRPVSVPERADREASDASGLTHKNGVYQLGETEGYFTAEYNFVPSDAQTLVFGKKDGLSYQIEVKNEKMALYKVNGSNKTLLGEKQILVPLGKLCTVRVENGDGVGYVYFNGMRVISYNAVASAGAMGYVSNQGVHYTAFTNDVFGTSDFEAVKNFPLSFPAVSYLKGENRGFYVKNAKQQAGGVRVGEKQDVSLISDAYAVNLAKEDWVKYGVDIGNSGKYIIGAKVSTSTNATLKITIGDSVLQCKVDGRGTENNGDGNSLNLTLGKIQLEKGLAVMKVEVLEGNASIISFNVQDGAEDLGEIKLADFTAFDGNVSVQEGSVTVSNNGARPGVAFWGNNGLGDFELNLTFNASADLSGNLGIMLRARNYSYFGSQVSQSWQGYYLSIQSQMISLKRYDYNEQLLGAVRHESALLTDASTHTLKITVKNNQITCVLDGAYEITAKDDYAHLSGKIGIYAQSGSITVTSASFKQL